MEVPKILRTRTSYDPKKSHSAIYVQNMARDVKEITVFCIYYRIIHNSQNIVGWYFLPQILISQCNSSGDVIFRRWLDHEDIAFKNGVGTLMKDLKDKRVCLLIVLPPSPCDSTAWKGHLGSREQFQQAPELWEISSGFGFFLFWKDLFYSCVWVFYLYVHVFLVLLLVRRVSDHLGLPLGLEWQMVVRHHLMAGIELGLCAEQQLFLTTEQSLSLNSIFNINHSVCTPISTCNLRT